MLILGIDPGYERLGVAVIEGDPSPTLLYSACIVTSSKLSHPERLKIIGKEIASVLKKFKPDEVAVETLFFNTNQKTALHVSEARGVVIYESISHGCSVSEYTPLQVKIAITGYGRGTKDQVIFMLGKLLTINKKIKHDDEYDAIAIALTHAVSYKQRVRIRKLA